jgi:hypothetical protein
MRTPTHLPALRAMLARIEADQRTLAAMHIDARHDLQRYADIDADGLVGDVESSLRFLEFDIEMHRINVQTLIEQIDAAAAWDAEGGREAA